MFSATQDYKDAMHAMTREVDLVISIGYNIDQTAADDITSITATKLELSNTSQVVDAIYELDRKLATFEGYGIKTSGGMTAPPITSVAYPPEAGLWSDVISDGDGAISWTMTIEFGSAHTSGLTIYTRETQVTAAHVKFYKNGSLTDEGDMTTSSGYIQYSDLAEYDKIVVSVTELEQAFSHVRITEIEFGASQTFNKSSLTGTVEIIEEEDPLMLSIPLNELDFDILNVDGKYDPDNSVGDYDSIKIGYTATVGITCSLEGGATETIPLGSFIIYNKEAVDNRLRVVCYDPRIFLRDTFQPWSLNTSTSWGLQLTALFTAMHVPHLIDNALLSVNPDKAIAFDGSESLLQCFLYLQQYYGLYLVPERDGYLHATMTKPSDDYGDMDSDMQFVYPRPSHFTTYNFISVVYDQQNGTTYDIDLRPDSRQVQSQILIRNPLITTSAKAQEVANAILAKFYDDMVEVDWRTDALTDIGDTVGLNGRWSENTTEYTVIRQDTSYDGSLYATLKGIIRN